MALITITIVDMTTGIVLRRITCDELLIGDHIEDGEGYVLGDVDDLTSYVDIPTGDILPLPEVIIPLEELKIAKQKEIHDGYNASMRGGFASNALSIGTEDETLHYWYKSAIEDRLNLTDAYMIAQNYTDTDPWRYSVLCKTLILPEDPWLLVDHKPSQVINLGGSGVNMRNYANNLLAEKMEEIEDAEDEEDLELIVWNPFE